MIELLREELITPEEAARYYPRGPGGRKVHVSRVYRDIQRGSHGIYLESVRTPRLATSREAVARFFARLTAVLGRADEAQTAPPLAGRNMNEVERQLDALGL